MSVLHPLQAIIIPSFLQVLINQDNQNAASVVLHPFQYSQTISISFDQIQYPIEKYPNSI